MSDPKESPRALVDLLKPGSVWVDRRDGRRVLLKEADDAFVWVMCVADNGERMAGCPRRSRVRRNLFQSRYRREVKA